MQDKSNVILTAIPLTFLKSQNKRISLEAVKIAVFRNIPSEIRTGFGSSTSVLQHSVNTGSVTSCEIQFVSEKGASAHSRETKGAEETRKRHPGTPRYLQDESLLVRVLLVHDSRRESTYMLNCEILVFSSSYNSAT